MTFDHLRRRLDRIERSRGAKPLRLGRLPTVWIVTRSDEDRERQLAALTASGECEPGRQLIDWRIVKPEGFDRELHRASPSSRSH